jgi:DNA-binding SARP family transcriptional activator
MTYEEAEKLAEKMYQEELAIGKTKGKEYTQTDRLDNFKRLAKELGVDPKVILWIYLRKHIDSIVSFIKTGGVLSEPIQGRITDARVYLFLLRGLVEEEQKHP